MFSTLLLEGLRRFEENVEAVTERAAIRESADRAKKDAAIEMIKGNMSVADYHQRKKEIRHQKNDDLICSYLDGIQRRLDRW